MRLMRMIYVVLLALIPMAGTRALAGDYTLNYAIDANGQTGTGKVESCRYEKTCEINSAGLELSLSLDPVGPEGPLLTLNVQGPADCCYSADAALDFYVRVNPGLLRVPVYRGKLRKGDEFVRNERFGTVYLEFSNLR